MRLSLATALTVSLSIAAPTGCTLDVVLVHEPASDAASDAPDEQARPDAEPDAGIDASAEAGLADVTSESAPDVSLVDAGSDAAAQQWTRVYVPTGSDLRSVWGSSSRDVWIVGDRGTILHWTGTVWSPVASPIRDAFYRDVWGSSANDVWAVGLEPIGNLVIAHYDGRAWTRVPLAPTRYSPRAVYGTSANDAWIVGGPLEFAGDTVLHWDGVRWSLMHTGGAPTRYLDIGGTGANDLWIVALDDTLLQWNGAFQLVAATLPVAVVSFELGLWARGPQDFWVTGDAGVLYRYTSGAWTSVDTGTDNLLRNVWGLNTGTMWAVGNRGTIARFDGASWSVLEDTTPRTLLSVWGASATDAWAVGEGGTVLHSVR